MSGIQDLLATIVSFLTILTIVGRYFILNPLKSFIKEQTYPIQPNANGGRSLADVARTLDKIENKLDQHIQQHLEGKA
jgi:F0F1-type ATP synthase membrane subunit b/b'